MAKQSETKNPATERLERAEEALDRANREFGRICDKIRHRIQVLSRIPAAAAFQVDMNAFALAIGAEQEAMDEFVEALKGVAQEGRHGG